MRQRMETTTAIMRRMTSLIQQMGRVAIVEEEKAVDQATEEQERELLQAGRHVKSAQAQRKLLNNKIKMMRETQHLLEETEDGEGVVYTLVVDYA